jgi:Ca2+-binding EF-hand superfamily protein
MEKLFSVCGVKIKGTTRFPESDKLHLPNSAPEQPPDLFRSITTMCNKMKTFSMKSQSLWLTAALSGLLIGWFVSGVNAQERGRDWGRGGEERGREGSRGGEERGRDWGRGGEDRREERRWDPTDFLRRMDTNGNGKIEPSEMNGRSEQYLQRLGFDTENPIPLDTIIDRVREEQGERSSTSSTSSARSAPAPKVPGFGALNEPVPNFGAMSDEQLEKMFSPDVIRRVNETMERYDRNRDGVLDEEELERGNWGSPPYQQSDLNGDGRLSRLELAYRYRARDAIRRESDDRNPSRREGRDPFDRSDRGTFNAEPMTGLSRPEGSRRGSLRDRTSSRDSSANSSSGSTEQRGGGADDGTRREQTARYVDSMLERYDADKDGKLNAEEVKEMRNPPPLGSDGFITKEQYVDFLVSGKKPNDSGDSAAPSAESGSAGGDAEATAANSGRPATGSRFGRASADRGGADRGTAAQTGTGDRRASERASTRSRNSFADFDINQNGMIEMHEFSEEWNDEKLAEYYQLDTNRDGVITRREWEAAGRR